MAQFAAFAEECTDRDPDGHLEMPVELAEGSRCLERFFRADFVGAEGMREMRPREVLAPNGHHGRIGGVGVRLDDLVWDDVVLAHDGAEIGPDAIQTWFLDWCDPDQTARPASGPFSGKAHSVILDRDEIWVDLGTAPADALIELLEVVSRAGAREVRVSASR